MKQETFNIVARHLLEQGAVSMRAGRDMCGYRGSGGMKCAAGILIPDDRSRDGLEGFSADEGEVAKILEELGHDTQLVRDLQEVHDFGNPSQWRIRLAEVGERHHLSIDVLTTRGPESE